VTSKDFISATSLLPGQDKLAPSGPTSVESCVAVSLPEVGLGVIPKPGVAWEKQKGPGYFVKGRIDAPEIIVICPAASVISQL